MANNSWNGSLIVAALILSASVVATGLILKGSLDHTGEQLQEVLVAINEARPAAAPTPAGRPGRPDPAKRYSVKIGDAPRRGAKNAKVSIVEFSDFQCPYCSRVRPTLDQIEKEYGAQVVIAFKHLPLSMHPKAPAAHAAAEAAHRQGKFWEMHDLIFANQREMSPAKYEEYAKQIGLDVARFKKDVASGAVKKRVEADAAQAASLGITGTPAFLVNGRYLSGAQPFPAFKRLIDAELGEKG
ncbi:MAG: thioredoxin domain-containing protein [Deltaproteobacteria bacterium]|nr:thioredoxin domain-containing protein [Deltaproteobacteria bacterium]MBW2362738.1 thioredoxin domain-containing protein [Deltaproteobacteria bacterium]